MNLIKKIIFIGICVIINNNICAFEKISRFSSATHMRFYKECFQKNYLNRKFYTTLSSDSDKKDDINNQRTVRILSIDGGGIRGIIPLVVLNYIEKETGKSISDLFDIISGTSTGGIISLGLAAPANDKAKYSAEDVKKLYTDNGNIIFSQPNIFQRYFAPLWNIFWTKYSHVELEKTLLSYFEEIKLSEARSTVIIPSYDITRSQIHVFNSYEASLKNKKSEKENDLYMREVARATSAAPTFFPIAKIRGNDSKTYHLIDGGIVANNPTLLAYAQAKKMFPNANDFLILSLGTGVASVGTTRYEEYKGAGFWRWGRRFPSLMINASSHAVDYHIDIFMSETKQIITGRKPRYFRFQLTELPANLAAMDSTQKNQIADLERCGENLIKSHKILLGDIIRELKSDRPYAGANNKLKPGVHLNEEGTVYMDEKAFKEELMQFISSKYGGTNAYFDREQIEKIKREFEDINTR